MSRHRLSILSYWRGAEHHSPAGAGEAHDGDCDHEMSLFAMSRTALFLWTVGVCRTGEAKALFVNPQQLRTRQFL